MARIIWVDRSLGQKANSRAHVTGYTVRTGFEFCPCAREVNACFAYTRPSSSNSHAHGVPFERVRTNGNFVRIGIPWARPGQGLGVYMQHAVLILVHTDKNQNPFETPVHTGRQNFGPRGQRRAAPQAGMDPFWKIGGNRVVIILVLYSSSTHQWQKKANPGSGQAYLVKSKKIYN